jgi:hypothetical protein
MRRESLHSNEEDGNGTRYRRKLARTAQGKTHFRTMSDFGSYQVPGKLRVDVASNGTARKMELPFADHEIKKQ